MIPHFVSLSDNHASLFLFSCIRCNLPFSLKAVSLIWNCSLSSEESLAEINEIFKVSGGSEMFDTIERHSDRKAREMGYEEGADQQYMMDVFLSNSNEHY